MSDKKNNAVISTETATDAPEAVTHEMKQPAAGNAVQDAESGDVGVYKHTFKKPFEYEGKTYEELTFDFGRLKGRDMVAIENEMQGMSEYALAPEISTSFLPEYASLDELKAHYRRGGLGDVKVKKLLIAILNETLDPIRARRKEYEGRIGEVYEILRRGSEEARKAAAQTLDEVRTAMKINYFSDTVLIEEQARTYAMKK